MQQQVIDEIAKFLAVTPQDIDPDATLVEDLGLNPIQISELLGHLAERFNITISPEEVNRLVDVRDVVGMVEDLSLE